MKRIALLALIVLLIPASAHALDTEELLSLVAMPLAVAAVAEIADVPAQPLFELVSLLNDAQVPPSEFIDVIRYAPAALVVNAEPDFVDFVRLQTTQGVTGVTLVRNIETELVDYGIPREVLVAESPRIVTIDSSYVPPIVRERIATRASHPHGGPPGQLKKELGYQTGAEVVHSAAGRDEASDRRDVSRRNDRDDQSARNDDKEPRASSRRVADVPRPQKPEKSSRVDGGNGKGKSDRSAVPAPQSVGKAKGNSGGKGNNGNSGKGNGKGKG